MQAATQTPNLASRCMRRAGNKSLYLHRLIWRHGARGVLAVEACTSTAAAPEPTRRTRHLERVPHVFALVVNELQQVSGVLCAEFACSATDSTDVACVGLHANVLCEYPNTRSLSCQCLTLCRLQSIPHFPWTLHSL